MAHGWSLYSLAGFALPLVIAFVTSLVLLLINRQSASSPERFLKLTPIATLVMAGVSVLIYLAFIMP